MPEFANPVTDNVTRHRYELTEQGVTAFADYRLGEGLIEIPHVETPVAARGGGMAGRLMDGLVEHVRARRLKIVPTCPYAAAWLRRHPEHADVLA
jgi:predicted GNAT family acetyltransferase